MFKIRTDISPLVALIKEEQDKVSELTDRIETLQAQINELTVRLEELDSFRSSTSLLLGFRSIPVVKQ